MTTEELLAVLDLPEEEQYTKLPYYIQPKPWKHISSGSFTPSSCDAEYCRKCRKPLRTSQDEESECPIPNGLSDSFADLAFRLRDEAVQNNLRGYPAGFMEPQRMVWVYVIQPATLLENGRLPDGKSLAEWWEYYSQPIHWIIAALIAKELSKEKENGKST